MVPTDDEILKVKQFEKEAHLLASAEKFMYEISEIPRYEQTLKAMLFKASYSELQEDSEKMVSGLLKACNQAQNATKFKELLRVILALGNYLNSGQRGGAFGFKLNSLLKASFI